MTTSFTFKVFGFSLGTAILTQILFAIAFNGGTNCIAILSFGFSFLFAIFGTHLKVEDGVAIGCLFPPTVFQSALILIAGCINSGWVPGYHPEIRRFWAAILALITTLATGWVAHNILKGRRPFWKTY